MKFLAIIQDTIREGLAKRTIFAMFIVTAVVIVIATFVFQSDTVQQGLLSPAETHTTVNGKAVSTQILGYTVLDGVWLAVYLSMLVMTVSVGTFVTAGFTTSFMEKGTIDVLLSKPVPRWMYILGRYSGAIVIIFAEVALMVLGLWLSAGISLGTWSSRFLWSIPALTLTFAGVFSLVTLLAVLTRSSWFALIIGLSLFLLASFVVPFASFLDRVLSGSTGGFLTWTGRVFHYTLPQANEVAREMKNAMFHQPFSFGPLLLAAAISIGYLVLSMVAFSRKEF